MADKKNEKEHSVEERLKTLYELQTILSEIDHFKNLRGELPNEVKDREDEIVRFQTRINKFEEEIANQRDLIAKKEADIKDRTQKIARYEEQINNVRNNREFTFLEKEKEFESLEIQLNEKNIRDARHKIEELEGAIARNREELTDNEHILEQKKVELNEIVSETKQQEETLMLRAKELEKEIDDYTLAAFKRIRKNARNGLGIVTVQRNACGGCFNRIPPQRQLEIKMHKKVIVCEYCGRIMIDAALAGIEEIPEEKVETKKRVVRPKKATL
ncbi:MAG: hypothetical protein K2N88_00695 [Muribaculaceae bacterium]|nr:hypothetical protein [Muribaculaceae bacterium]